MRIVAEVKAPFLHSQLGFNSPSFTETAIMQLADRFVGELLYAAHSGLLLALGPLSQEAERAISKLRGRTVA